MSSAKRTLTLKRRVGLTQAITWKPGGTAQDLTGWTIYMQVREREDSSSPLLLQISSEGVAPASRIEIDADQVTNTGLLTIYVTAADATAFGADVGIADIVAVSPIGQRALIGRSGWRIVAEEVVTIVEDYP